MDYPGDVVAGALIGIALAGGLYVLPTRRLIQAVARRVGVVWDGLCGRPQTAAV